MSGPARCDQQITRPVQGSSTHDESMVKLLHTVCSTCTVCAVSGGLRI